MTEELRKACPVCGGFVKVEDGFLDQTHAPLPAIVETCIGGKTGAYGCGHKSWRKKVAVTET
jgi:hypothetical protein